MQRPNTEVAARLKGYNEVVILTGRNLSDCNFTERQIRRLGIRFDKIVCCTRKDLINQWKVSVVSKLADKHEIDWIDDELDQIMSTSPNLDTKYAIRLLKLTCPHSDHVRELT